MVQIATTGTAMQRETNTHMIINIKRKAMNKFILIPLLIVLLVFHACNNQEETCDGLDHEEVKIIMAGYGSHFEIFAEADPLATGTTSSIMLHISCLEQFKPVSDAKVTLSLITGHHGIRQTVHHPGRPGIYRFAMQPEHSGLTRVYIDIETSLHSERIDAGLIAIYEDYHQALHMAEHEMADIPGSISFTKEQSWAVEFATTIVSKEKAGMVIKTAGEVLPARDNEFIVSAQTNGVIQFISGDLLEGVQVIAGQALLNIAGDGLAEGNSRLRLAEAQNNYERAKADFKRLEILAKEKIVNEKELNQAKNEYSNTKVIYDNLIMHFTEHGQTVKSPVSGFITHLIVENGQYVESGQALVSVSQNSRMIIRAEVQQRYAHILPNLISANIRNTNGETLPLEAYQGSFLSYSKNINALSYLLPVHMNIGDPRGLIPGSLVDVYLKTLSEKEVILIPTKSLIEEQGNYFVFVQIHPESFEKRLVHVGQSDGLNTEITAGLVESERIVSRGAIIVKLAATSGNLDPHSGHVH